MHALVTGQGFPSRYSAEKKMQQLKELDVFRNIKLCVRKVQ